MPRRIATTEELRAIIAAGSGYVFNTDGKKLHLATCGWVRGMRLGTPELRRRGPLQLFSLPARAMAAPIAIVEQAKV